MWLAYADHLVRTNSLDHVRQANRLVPCNSQYLGRLSALLDEWGEKRTDSVAILHAAVACNPRDSPSWIELGLKAEAEGNFTMAEKHLLEAARVDRQFDPRWTLANFYLRRNDAEHFWRWAKEAAAMSYGDLAPLFRLSWRMTQDAGLILERAIPDQPEILAQYVSFLLAENHLEAAAVVAQRLVGRAGKTDLPVLFTACDRFIEEGELQAALNLWGSLCSRKLIAYPAPAVEGGRSLTNGEFRMPPLMHGFDWHLQPGEGISMLRQESPPGLRIIFSGKQSENCELLSQLVPLIPARDYRLSFRYQTSMIPPNAGLHWRIVDAQTGTELAKASPNLSSERERSEAVLFSSTAETRWARVIFEYRRATGTTRVEGSILLREASLAFATP
jgi:tetratricopeptide (TPR) repeat protein